MKKLIAIVLILASVFALCACGKPAAAGKEAAKETETAVDAPAENQSTADKNEPEVSAPSAEISEEQPAEPELPPEKAVEITVDNFFDYFEFQQFPPDNLDFKRTSAGKIYSVIAASGFYLKDGYRIDHDKAGQCKVEVGVKYQISWFTNGNKGINIDPANCKYEVTLKANDITDQEEQRESYYLTYPDGTEMFAIMFSCPTILTTEKDASTMIVEPDGVELVSASGTLYLMTEQSAD